MGGAIEVVSSKAQWSEAQNKAKSEGRAVVVDFTATWCGPCRMIAPYYEELSGEFTGVVFLKVDVDKVEDVAAECGVSAMPTFQVWRGGEMVEELVGASKERLKALIEKYNAAV